ncbi:MAG: hypothetical protein J3Q66DRAFT_358612 [Benniella sp.]|nr:MAG: hypothetical protein J3Q66DRAFT_358612 [Benniella sp.]
MDTITKILSKILTAHYGVKYGIAMLAYMALVRHLRYKRINNLLKKYPDPTVPLRDLEVAREVSSAVSDLEFPYLNMVAQEYALFKTLAIPSISKILAATRQFTGDRFKRADDTTYLFLEMNEHYSRNLKRVMTEGKVDENEVQNDIARHEIAIQKLNFLHGQYNIKQEDFLYTLALLIVEPDIFINQFEWRPLTELERNSLYAIWINNGKKMGIKNIPETKAELIAWSEEYERTHSRFAKSNRVIADVTLDILLSLIPSFTRGLGRMAASALCTPLLREAFGLSPPPKTVSALVHGALWARAAFIKYFMLPRRLPLVRTAARANEEGKYVPNFHKYKPVYSDGYRVEDLGPEKFVGKCPISFRPSGITPGTSTQQRKRGQV